MAEGEGQPQDVSSHDYHRTVIGYHGTTTATAERLVGGHPFEPSENDDDWLGRGIYFWEYAPKQAWWWAETFKRHNNAAVVGAIIRLGHCFDLLDPVNVQVLKEFHRNSIEKWRESGFEIPQNGNQHKKLDCAIFNLLYSSERHPPIETTRAVYVPTASARRVWRRSWIYEQAHIQISIRKAENILAVWPVRRDGRYGKDAE